MKIIQVPVADLKRPERNIRIHTEKQLREYERSITMFGQLRPIVVDENNVIMCGVGLHETLIRMGKETASVLVAAGLTPQQKKKLMIADNKIFSLGIDDLNSLDQFISELQGDYDVPGYDEDVLRALMAEAQDVEDVISAYGTLDPDEIAGMKTMGERRDAAAEQAAAAPPQMSNATISPVPDGRRSVVCPKCGETIWL